LFEVMPAPRAPNISVQDQAAKQSG